jgi:hypothetical protein
VTDRTCGVRGAAMVTLLLGVAALAACQSQQMLSQESDLSEAGFTVQIADTAERQNMLNRLPPNRFVQRGSGDNIQYVFADPACGCLYMGSQQAFYQYVMNKQLDLGNAERMAFINYYDAAWNWDAWGPWGPLGPIYGPGW